MGIRIENWNDASDRMRKALMQRPALHADQKRSASVRDIIADVRKNGNKSVRKFTEKFDGVDMAIQEVSALEFQNAERDLSSAQLNALELAMANVRRFHEAQRPVAISIETMSGVHCERISHPLDAVGLYVPAGTAPLPSTAIMLAVPARIAGCPIKILCTPPRPDGSADSAVLVAARLAGVDTIFKIGGAQAIAAMAYGTETVPKVTKVFGPGNAWVTEAKTQVATDPQGAAIDMPAGPSELLVIADEHANAEFVAADLLSQAEHGADSQVILLSPCQKLAEAVARAIQRQLKTLSRKDIAGQSIENSRIIVVGDIPAAVDVSNRYAPEHLILHLKNARDVLGGIRNAGSVFVGTWSPESAGDYCSGTNHVLPTYGHARSFSGLSVDQFMRQMTIQEMSQTGLKNIGESIIELAKLEGLDAHAAAVECRLAALGRLK
jgi:histidinol dehydrogenase